MLYYLNYYYENYIPFKGAVSVLHVKVTDSPSLTVADCGNVANAGLFGSSFGAGRTVKRMKIEMCGAVARGVENADSSVKRFVIIKNHFLPSTLNVHDE